MDEDVEEMVGKILTRTLASTAHEINPKPEALNPKP